MRLLVITSTNLFPSEARPHAGIFFANLMRRLATQVERIIVVSPAAYVPRPLLKMQMFAHHRTTERHQWWHGIEVVRPPYFSLRTNRHLYFQARMFCASAAPTAMALHRRHRFDLVIGYGFGMPAYAAQYVAGQARRRCVAWAIGTDVHTTPRASTENTRLLRYNVRHTDVVLTESDALRRQILGYCPGSRHVHTFCKGIDVEGLTGRASRSALRASLGFECGRTYMLSAGRVAEYKGVREFYDAFKRLAPRWPGLSATWIGSGPEAAPLRARAQEDGLADRFTITGTVPRERVLEFMRAADVMAFPSHAEGLPNVVMEALAAGLPTVATDVGGASEVVVDGKTGLLTPPRDAAGLARRVEQILNDPHWAGQMAERGRRLVFEHFNVDRNAPVALAILKRIASGGPPESPLPPCAGIKPGKRPTDSLRIGSSEPAAGP